MNDASTIRAALSLMLLIAAPASTFGATDHKSSSTNCQPQNGIEFVCGMLNAEDLAQIPNSKWIVTSGFALKTSPGAIYLLDSEAKSFSVMYPGKSPSARLDREMFGECAGPPDPARFSAHGIALLAGSGGVHRLYVAAHGERESVEIFDLDTRGTKPSLTWVGCVVLPPEASVNSVAPFSDGGFVVTRIFDTSDSSAGRSMLEGKITGFIYEWHPGGSPRPIAGSELSGPNGVLLSPDQKWMYVAAYGSRQIVRFSRGERLVQDGVLQLDFNPDNLRWSAKGRILVAGHRQRLELIGTKAFGTRDFIKDGMVIAEIDPSNLTLHPLFTRPSMPGFLVATAAISTAHGFWVGAIGADRIAFIRAEKESK